MSSAKPSPQVENYTAILTESQAKVLDLALRNGYFETPRAITLRELAEMRDCSHQATSELMRRAFASLAEAALEGGLDEPVAMWTGSAPHKARKYHVNPNCHRLEGADADPRLINKDRADFHGLEKCKDCPNAYSLV